jgi:molecular chaperone DnaK
VGNSEFGRDAVKKARALLDRVSKAAESGDVTAAQADLDTLQRTERMFKGVLARTS